MEFFKVQKMTRDVLINLEKVVRITINRDNEDGRYDVNFVMDDGNVIETSLSESGLNELLIKIGEVEILDKR